MAIKLPHVFATLLIFAIAAFILFGIGRIPFCECDTIKFWISSPAGAETSQQFSDPYTFSHVLHGIAFFWILWFLRKKLDMSLGMMLIIATFVEATWEIFENTEFIINRYREATISLAYYGDTIFNSMGDIFSMIVGFALAARYPWWISILFVLVVELAMLYLIRDNLILNIVMLIYPIEAIRMWQGGG